MKTSSSSLQSKRPSLSAVPSSKLIQIRIDLANQGQQTDGQHQSQAKRKTTAMQVVNEGRVSIQKQHLPDQDGNADATQKAIHSLQCKEADSSATKLKEGHRQSQNEDQTQTSPNESTSSLRFKKSVSTNQIQELDNKETPLRKPVKEQLIKQQLGMLRQDHVFSEKQKPIPQRSSFVLQKPNIQSLPNKKASPKESLMKAIRNIEIDLLKYKVQDGSSAGFSDQFYLTTKAFVNVIATFRQTHTKQIQNIENIQSFLMSQQRKVTDDLSRVVDHLETKDVGKLSKVKKLINEHEVNMRKTKTQPAKVDCNQKVLLQQLEHFIKALGECIKEILSDPLIQKRLHERRSIDRTTPERQNPKSVYLVKDRPKEYQQLLRNKGSTSDNADGYQNMYQRTPSQFLQEQLLSSSRDQPSKQLINHKKQESQQTFGIVQSGSTSQSSMRQSLHYSMERYTGKAMEPQFAQHAHYTNTNGFSTLEDQEQNFHNSHCLQAKKVTDLYAFHASPAKQIASLYSQHKSADVQTHDSDDAHSDTVPQNEEFLTSEQEESGNYENYTSNYESNCVPDNEEDQALKNRNIQSRGSVVGYKPESGRFSAQQLVRGPMLQIRNKTGEKFFK